MPEQKYYKTHHTFWFLVSTESIFLFKNNIRLQNAHNSNGLVVDVLNKPKY